MTVSVRQATSADAFPIWQWRNDATTREMSRSTAAVALEDHRAWFARVLDDPGRHLLVAESAGAAVGIVRFDATSPAGTFTVSINLDPAARGRGLATPALEAGRLWLAENVPSARRLVAEVRPDNAPSIRTFESAGYVRTTSEDDWAIYERPVAESS